MSSRKLQFSAEAQIDVQSILQYTLGAWGESQHDTYAERLDAAMQDLLRFPQAGRARDDIAAGLRSHPVGEHVIYYRVEDEVITIVRLLHRRMSTAVLQGG